MKITAGIDPLYVYVKEVRLNGEKVTEPVLSADEEQGSVCYYVVDENGRAVDHPLLPNRDWTRIKLGKVEIVLREDAPRELLGEQTTSTGGGVE